MNANTTTTIPTTHRRRAFWLRVRKFALVALLVTALGAWSGAAMAGGWPGLMTTFWKGCLGALGAAALGTWVPVAFYYEGHRYRWIYIVMAFFLMALLALVVSYAMTSA